VAAGSLTLEGAKLPVFHVKGENELLTMAHPETIRNQSGAALPTHRCTLNSDLLLLVVSCPSVGCDSHFFNKLNYLVNEK
jgi:hypothetical protein